MRFLTDILAKAGLVVDGTTTLNGAAAATVDTDKFVVLDGSVVKYRTGAQVLSDIGGGTVTSVSLATGTTGTDVNVSGSPITSSGTITLNIPSASATARGLVTTSTQTFAGAKTFSGTSTTFSGLIDLGSYIRIQSLTLSSGSPTTGKGFVWYNNSNNRLWFRNDANEEFDLTATGSGTVSSVSVVSANGFAGTVATASTTPAITLSTTVTGLLKGNGTAISAAVAGTDFQSPISLTTTGNSGAATFSSNTLNIPNYTLAGLGGVPTSRTLTINGTAFDLSADRSWTVSGGTSTTRYNEEFTATSNQTAFTVTNALTNGYFDVYLNGVKLDPNSFTNTSTVITLVDGARAGDILQVVNYSTLGIVSTLPSQTGNSGKYLTTDGTNLSWATVSSGAYTVTSVSTTYSETATSGTKIIKANTTGGTFTITLPTAVGNTATLIIKKTAGSADLTIDGAGSETIDGGATATVRRVDESVTLISDNSNWFIV